MSIQVAGGFGGSGGSFGLDISVVSQLPSAVQEGAVVLISSSYTAVYVDTDTPASPAAGDIWVQVGPSAHATEPAENTRLGLVNARQYSADGWQVINGYVGADGEWSQFSEPLPPSGQPLESYTWAQISAISQAGLAASYFQEGNTKSLTIGDADYSVVIVGFGHDSVTGGGVAGITFGLTSCLADSMTMYATNSSVGGWTDSIMRSNFNGTVLSQLPADLQAVILPVDKVTSQGAEVSTLVTTSDKLFAFSEVELFNTSLISFPGEGIYYSYFASDALRIRTQNGAAAKYFTRSPYATSTLGFCAVASNGGASSDASNTPLGAVFGFCV